MHPEHKPPDLRPLPVVGSVSSSSAFWNARVNKLSNRSEDSDLDRSRIQWNSKPTDAVYKVRLTHKFGRGKQFSAHVARVGEGYFLARENNSILRNVEKCEWAKEMRSYGMSGRVEWVRNGVLNGKGCCGLGRLRNLKIARGLVWGLVMSAESYASYVENMPWLIVPWQQAAVRAELAQLYGIRGIPTLLLLDRNGHIITTDARTELAEDPMAQNFPWKPRAVNILTERYANKLHDYPAIVLFVDGEETELQFAESVLSPAADCYYKKHNINFNCAPEDFSSNCEDDHYLQFLIGLDSETSDILRDLIGLDDVVPLLVGIDIPNRRFAVMEYGVEITVDAVSDFVEKFQKGEVKFIDVNDRVVEDEH
ncbi:hypothetical protein Zmor_016697 [Zophobas morio]|uniref:Nucleoredoxin n=1 Tax=Zophobas morio TaxID=2755281 RepID=A0AA38IAV0_9CUCU|nr:hypothetical protein Zmor_016697 [Zophobas morio]